MPFLLTVLQPSHPYLSAASINSPGTVDPYNAGSPRGLAQHMLSRFTHHGIEPDSVPADAEGILRRAMLAQWIGRVR